MTSGAGAAAVTHHWWLTVEFSCPDFMFASDRFFCGDKNNHQLLSSSKKQRNKIIIINNNNNNNNTTTNYTKTTPVGLRMNLCVDFLVTQDANLKGQLIRTLSKFMKYLRYSSSDLICCEGNISMKVDCHFSNHLSLKQIRCVFTVSVSSSTMIIVMKSPTVF